MNTTTLEPANLTDPVEILQEARRRISDPCRWSKGVLYRDDSGKPTTAQHAFSACSMGHLEIVTQNEDFDENNLDALVNARNHLSRAAAQNMSHYLGMFEIRCITHYNDKHTHEEILALFDRAIELAKIEAKMKP